MYELEEYASLVGHTNDNGEKGYYKLWHIDIDGDCIASEYHRLNLTPEDVKAIVESAEGAISDAIYDAIDKALDEYLGTH